MLRTLVIFGVILIAGSGTALPACLPVAGDRIFGRDLALAIPAFSALPSGTVIGYAPAPGTQRIFSVAELTRIARANRVTLESPSEVCFEISMRAMEAEETLAAMRSVLPPNTELSLVELPKTSVPAGRLEFALAGLEPDSRGSRVWRGFVRYGATLRAPVQVRVTVQRKVVAVIAARDLPANTTLDATNLRLQPVVEPFGAVQAASRTEDVLGRVAKKPLRAGETISLASLSIPPVVHKGDAIKVEVQSGGARLVFDAVAQSAAGDGEMVELKNPDNGRVFRARVAQTGRAVIVVPSRQTL
jgi:flagella basal body P-ring formation protein FlgA